MKQSSQAKMLRKHIPRQRSVLPLTGWARRVEGVNQPVWQVGPASLATTFIEEAKGTPPTETPRPRRPPLPPGIPSPHGNWQGNPSSFPRSLVVLLPPGFESRQLLPPLSTCSSLAPFLSFFRFLSNSIIINYSQVARGGGVR